MSKLTFLKKKLVQQAVVMAVGVAVCAGIYMFVSAMAESAVKQKTDGESDLAQQASERDALKAKIDGAASSERNYLDLSLLRSGAGFSATREEMVKFLNDVRARRRLNGVKVTLSPEVTIRDTALVNPAYDVTLRDSVALEFSALSDLQAMALVADLTHAAPGFVTVKAMDIDRKTDLTPPIINQMAAGMQVDVVAVKMDIAWAGVREKENETTPVAAAPNAAPPTANSTPAVAAPTGGAR